MKVLIFAFAALSLASCVQSSSDKKQTNAANASPTPGGTGQPYPTGGQPGTTTDIVVVSAIGAENTDQTNNLKTSINNLLSAIGQKVASGNLRVALLANPVATVSGVGLSLSQVSGFSTSNSLQVNYELSPADALLGALVPGCDESTTDLNSTHAAGNVKVCNASVAVPAHSWTWSVEDTKGKMKSFLRPGATRIYIIVASNDATIVTQQQFSQIASTQNNNGPVRVYAIVPTAIGGFCKTQNLVANNLISLAQSSSGKAYSYCQPDWSQYVSEIVGSF